MDDLKPVPVETIWQLIKATFINWYEDEAPRLGAALAFYTAFSMAPLLLIVVAVVGLFYQGDTEGQIQRQLASLVGVRAAEAVAVVIMDAAQNSGVGIQATVIGLVVLFLAATAVFSELRAAMNKIWNVQAPATVSFKSLFVDRILSFTMVIAVVFLLLVSMVVSAVLASLNMYLSDLIPGVASLWFLVDLTASLVIITVLFTALFRYGPDVRLPWQSLWVGGAITAVLFILGKFLIGLYLGRGTVGSSFGAAASVLVILLWVYYSAQIVFLGAEFIQVYNNRYLGQPMPPPPSPAKRERVPLNE